MPDDDDPFDIDTRDTMPDVDDANDQSPLDDSLALASLSLQPVELIYLKKGPTHFHVYIETPS